MVRRIRHSIRLVATLPPDLQKDAQASYGIALRMVFTLAACSSFLAFVIRFVVRALVPSARFPRSEKPRPKIPDKSLDEEHASDAPPKAVTGDDVEQQAQAQPSQLQPQLQSQPQPQPQPHPQGSPQLRHALSRASLAGSCAITDDDEEGTSAGARSTSTPTRRLVVRRLSTYELTEGGADLEGEMAGSARR
jgi:hypothetical protein